MRFRRFALVALFVAFVLPLGLLPSPGFSAEAVPYAVASESYYRVDTDTGRMTVRVHGKYKNMQAKALETLPVYVMPGAENVVVKDGDQVLEFKLTEGSEATAQAGFATAKLFTPLKQNLPITLDATYDIAPRTGGKLMTLEAGLVESAFIGQGPGSFVLVDVPAKGDNYFDPGCLKASDQPKDVRADGFVRWVCGEVLVIAVNGDNPDVLLRCAGMDDTCRQRQDTRVFSAYVQSVTDASKAAKLEADVAMPDGRTVRLVLKYFKRDQAWADRQWPIALKAFPMLETLFGWRYPGEGVTMRQSHHLEIAELGGLALDGEVLLTTNSGFDEEVTIHELAHMWAGYNLETKWIWEGLAEFATRAIAGELGVTPVDRGWAAKPYKDPLATWYNGSIVADSDYWYGKAGAFFFAYEKAIGGRGNMMEVLSRMDDEAGLLPLDAGWFMDQGEWVGNHGLDATFTEWVFNAATSRVLLEERRAAHNEVRDLQARALTMGLSGMPSDVYDNLIAWVFDPVSGQVAKGHKVLDSYAQVIAESAAAGLGTPEGVGRAWGKKKLSESLAVVEEQRQAIIVITSATTELASKPDDSTAKQKLAEAREKYSAGDYSAAKSAAAGGVTAAYNDVAAGKMIEIAKEKQRDYSPDFFGRIGLYFTNPDADLKAAEEAAAAGDGKAALKLARGAYDTWEGATQRGIQRLAMVAAAMCGLTFLVWWLLRRMDGPVTLKTAGGGHHLEEAGDRKNSWRDWENSER